MPVAAVRTMTAATTRRTEEKEELALQHRPRRCRQEDRRRPRRSEDDRPERASRQLQMEGKKEGNRGDGEGEGGSRNG